MNARLTCRDMKGESKVGIGSNGGMPCEHGVLWGNEYKVNMGCDGLIQGRHRE